MSTLVSTNGSRKTAPHATDPISPGSRDHGLYIAQIPDLDYKPATKRKPKRLDGRIISQAMSIKLVFGVGIGLLIGAIVPHLFGKGSSPKPVHELPPWNVRSPEQVSPSTAQSVAPPWSPAPQQATVVAPQTPPTGVTPQPPQPQGYQPAALGQHAWTPPQPPALPPTATPPVAPAGQNFAQDNLREAPPMPQGNYDRQAPDRRAWQADARNDAVYDYRGNRVDTTATGRDTPPAGGNGDYRYNRAAEPAGVRPGSPLMPSRGNAAGGNSGYPQDAESGVARFDGTITAPPARTN
jgi:hypothetical protein